MENNAETITRLVMEKLPGAARRARGPYALFECFQAIPCNPCYTACPCGAVQPMENINDIPRLDYETCTGCGACLPICPGLAIFIIDETFSADRALIKFPYEYLPLPQKGAEVDAVDREGRIVCRATVERVQSFKNKTAIVSLAIPKEYTFIARGMSLPVTSCNREFTGPCAEEPSLGAKDSIVCRCEDISLAELRSVLEAHKLTLAEIKLDTRMSMGPCQGGTCVPLALQEIARRTNTPVGDLPKLRKRQPIKPVTMGSLAGVDISSAGSDSINCNE